MHHTERRRKAFCEILEGKQLKGFLVSQEVNVRYLSGFTGDSAWLLVLPGKAYFLTDGRYIEQARQEVSDYEVVMVRQSLLKESVSILGQHGMGPYSLDSGHVTLALFQQMQQENPEMIWTWMEDPCQSLRQIKDDQELECLKKAAALGDKAMSMLVPMLRPGLTEKKVALMLYNLMMDLGSEGLSFETIVASGWRSSLPHGRPSDKPLDQGDLITIDFGCVLEGYHSDMTRTFILGRPEHRQEEVYRLVYEAQKQALQQIRAGQTGQEADALARSVIERAGYSAYFGHGLGHSMGLEIHENPRLSPLAPPQALAPNMVVSVEPGVYIPQWGGVRIEDMICITEKGCDILTKFPKTLEEMTIIC